MHSLPSLVPFRTIPSFPAYRSRLIRPSRFCCCCHNSYPASRPPALRLHRELPPIACSSYPGVTAKANAISLLEPRPLCRHFTIQRSSFSCASSPVGDWTVGKAKVGPQLDLQHFCYYDYHIQKQLDFFTPQLRVWTLIVNTAFISHNN